MNKRIIAVLGVLIVVLSASFAGCGKKVTQEEKTTTDSGKIILDGTFDDIPEGSEIVIGNDGQSYLVDGEGNSVVYEAPSAYVIPNSPTPGITPPQAASSTTAAPTTKPTTTIKVIPSTTSQQESVLKTLTPLRSEGFNDDEVKTKLSGSNLKSMNLSFDVKDENGQVKEFLLYEIHKGAYGSSTIGWDAGLYTRKSTNNGYRLTSNGNVSYSARLFKSETEIKTYDEKGSSSSWKYNFLNSSAVAPSALTMIVTVTFKGENSFEMMDSFTNALEGYGIREGSTSSSKNVNNYSVKEHVNDADPYVVTFVW